jgi:hypothetical protein
VDVHYKRSAHGYYRGVRALNLARGSALTYNIVGHSVTLTEDRTIEHSFIFDLYVRNAIANASDERFLIEVIEAPRDSYEASINFADADLGPAILRLLDGAHFSRCHNHSLLRAYEKARGRNKTPRRLEPDRNEEKTLSRALELLGVLGIDVEHYPIVVTDELEDNVLGLAHDRKIFVNRRTFMQGVKMVAGTVYEEYLHLHHGLGDETRAMQNYLIDALMTAGEMLKGEPA